jgi:2OG-Fe(II) oxygenase superfamily/ShK domain-like
MMALRQRQREYMAQPQPAPSSRSTTTLWIWIQLAIAILKIVIMTDGTTTSSTTIMAAEIHYSGINYRTASVDRFHYQQSPQQQIPRREFDFPPRNVHYEQHLEAGNEPIIIRDTYHYEEIHDIQSDYRNTHYTCINLRETCDTWAEQDGCTKDPLFMYHHCPVSCHVCPEEIPMDHTDHDDDEVRNNDFLHESNSQYVPILYGIPLHETFGVREFNPMIHAYTASSSSSSDPHPRPLYPVLPLNGLFIHSILSDGRNVQDQIPPQRATILTSALTLPYGESIYFKNQRIIEEKVRLVNRYLTEVVDVEHQYRLVRDKCRTVIAHTDCAIWSIPSVNQIDGNTSFTYEYDRTSPDTTATDRCREDWEFMKSHGCYAFCFKCEYLHIESVCPVDSNEKNAWYPGDVDVLFTNIIQRFNDTYNITVLSRPYIKDDTNGDMDDEDSEKVDGPWIIQLDNFLSEEEANSMIELGHKIGYARSNQVGDLDEFGKNTDHVTAHRTSRNAWCDTDECMDHEVVQRLYDRIYNLTSIDGDHSEAIQLLQYTPGQYYRTHNDYIDYEIHRQQGVRILTIFAYLNTMPEYIPTEDEIKVESDDDDDDFDDEKIISDENIESTARAKYTISQHQNNGGTNFPNLNVTVRPKLGRVIMWTNVLNDYPNHIDDRTDHQALVVTHGTKYGANFWFHQRAFTCDEED